MNVTHVQGSGAGIGYAAVQHSDHIHFLYEAPLFTICISNVHEVFTKFTVLIKMTGLRITIITVCILQYGARGTTLQAGSSGVGYSMK
jgi:hypothetical protein